MKNLIVIQSLALCLVLLCLTMRGAAQSEDTSGDVYTPPTPQHSQRNFNFGGMLGTFARYIVRAINFMYELVNSPTVCKVLNTCRETPTETSAPENPGPDVIPYSVEENLISPESLVRPEYTGPLIDALLAANVDSVKADSTAEHKDYAEGSSGREYLPEEE